MAYKYKTMPSLSIPAEDDCSVLAAAHLRSCLPSASTEPLNVCLDDDSSIEDGDEDMFDDDAFAFGDEDFAALMSHESMRRLAAPIGRLAPSPAPAAPAQGSHLPLQSAQGGPSPLSEKTASVGTLVSADSMTSTAASSLASLGTLASQTSCTSMSKRTKSRRRVSLHNDVAVVPIPSRDEYPPRIRERIWSSADELCQNAARNAFEFASEGFDWRNVADDDRMVRFPGGERVHPAHFANVGGKEARPSTPVGMEVESVPS